MTEKQKPSLIKPILIIILTSLLYIFLVKPARLIANKKISYPLISTIFSKDKVSLPSNELVAVIINQNNLNDKLWITLPFGGFYIIPTVLLALKRNWILVKKLSYYHLFLSMIPFTFLIPIFNKVINYIPFGISQQLSIVLGFVFTMIALKDFSTDY